MSQAPKKPQSRDISELKARLGLKKAGPPPAATPGRSGSGTVVPPPGLSMPAPPGATSPPPVALPDASEDPFGAMNAMAAQAKPRGAEYIIVNDGKPVESVAHASNAGSIAKLAAIAVVPLILGVVIGQIAKEGKFYNASIGDAKVILSDVKAIKKGLVELQGILEVAAKKGFKVDKKLTADLQAKSFTFDPARIFRAKQNALSPDLSGQILSFYSGVHQISGAIADHVKTAGVDDASLAAAQANADKNAPENPAIAALTAYKYGVVLTSEQGGPFGANIVELGPPMCGDGSVPPSGVCPGGAASLTYRTTFTGGWSKAELAQPGGSFAPKQLIPLIRGAVADGLVRNGEPGAAEFMYKRRLAKLYETIDELIKEANAVETKLNAKSNEGEKFTFFL